MGCLHNPRTRKRTDIYWPAVSYTIRVFASHAYTHHLFGRPKSAPILTKCYHKVNYEHQVDHWHVCQNIQHSYFTLLALLSEIKNTYG